MKSFYAKIILLVTGLMLFSANANAEHIFKTDGTIIEGRITVDTADTIVVVTPRGDSVTIKRSSIMRILYTKIYLGKVYIRMTDGVMKEGYIVDEDRDSYKYRKELHKAIEEILPRSKVMFIARSNPTDLAGNPGKHHISFKWSPPYRPPMKYKVYFQKPGEKDFSVVSETSDTTITISGLKSNTKYIIYVTAIDHEGVESLPSDKVDILTLNDPPSPPGNLVKTESGSKKGKNVVLKWDESTDTDGKIKEYRIFTRQSGGGLKEIATTRKTEFELKGVSTMDLNEVRVVAVDDLGAYSGESIIREKSFSARLRPVITIPFGTMGELWGPGYGTYAGFFVADFPFNNIQCGIETGYIYWTGNHDAIDAMHMLPVLASFGYRYYFTGRISALASVNAGGIYMLTEYTDAAMQQTTKDAFEPMFSGSVLVEYMLTDSIYLFAGGEYSVIYETSELQQFAGVTLGAGYRFY